MTERTTGSRTGLSSRTRGTRTQSRTQTQSRTHTQVAATRRGRAVRTGLVLRAAAAAVGTGTSRAWEAVGSVVTSAGWFAAAWAAFGMVAGVVWGWSELLVGGVVALALVVIAAFFLIGREPRDVAFAVDRDAVVAGQPAEGSVTVSNSRARLAWASRLDLPIGPSLSEVHVPALRHGQAFTATVALPTHRRGIIDVGPATTAREDPLRLVRREFRWSDVHTLYVHPRTVAVPSTAQGFIRDLEGAATRVLSSEDISFHAVRDYTPGDARRHVHWKSTAKTGSLMVRQFEETRRSTMVLMLDLDAGSYGSEAEFEMAVSAIGSLGVRAIRDGRDVEVYVSGAVPHFARATVRSLERLRTVSPRALLDDLSGVETSTEVMDLDTLTRVVAEKADDASIAFMVTGAAAALEHVQTAAFAFPSDVSVAAVLCDPVDEPSVAALGRVQVVTIALLEDLRSLMARGASR
ncbi:DUF58 domain-containing protein [Demequina gelatinilytica]|uniref:DUF58 domain-containing protein n=1 Tax=Demequina gelatinilytica TaxID=1638980 RepID=UPI000786576E|nr:DUF58 domain-containing protein [Demequina gelatinilytica]